MKSPTLVAPALLLAQLVVAQIVVAEPVYAHGREAALTAVAFDRDDPNHVVLRGTFGLLSSLDGGANFVFRCPGAVGFDAETEDVALSIGTSSRLFVGGFSGLFHAENDACDFTPNSSIRRRYVADVQTLSGQLFVLDAPGDAPNTLRMSRDGGATFLALYSDTQEMLFERLRIAPSEPRKLYISGVIPGNGQRDRVALLLRSSDGGQSFARIDIPISGDERNVQVLAVDPADPDRLWLRVVVRAGASLPERVLESRDGGRTLMQVFSGNSIANVVRLRDQLYVAGIDGVFVANAAQISAVFAPVPIGITRVRCLVGRATSELWVCGRNLEELIVARWNVETPEILTPIWRARDAVGTMGCACDTQVGTRCRSELADYFLDVGRGNQSFVRECTSPQRDAGGDELPYRSGCGCAVGAPAVPLAVTICGVCLLFVAFLKARRRL